MCGTPMVAAGSAATLRAIQSRASMPHPIGVSASPSSPNGASASAARPAGITHIAVSGTAARLASTK